MDLRQSLSPLKWPKFQGCRDVEWVKIERLKSLKRVCFSSKRILSGAGLRLDIPLNFEFPGKSWLMLHSIHNDGNKHLEFGQNQARAPYQRQSR
jgi:hypothetical protein